MKRLIALIIVALMGIAILIGLRHVVSWAMGGWGTEITTTAVTSTQMNMCANAMHLTFPPSTKPIGLHMVEWQDATILLKITMDPSDLNTFLQKSPFAGKTLRNDQLRISIGTENLRWWATCSQLKPFEWKQGQQAFLSDETDLPENNYLRILLDLRDTKTVVVYLEYLDV